MTYSKEFLQRTINVWQPYNKEKLALSDAEEIARNVANLFELLMELDQKQIKSKQEQGSMQANDADR